LHVKPTTPTTENTLFATNDRPTGVKTYSRCGGLYASLFTINDRKTRENRTTAYHVQNATITQLPTHDTATLTTCKAVNEYKYCTVMTLLRTSTYKQDKKSNDVFNL